MFFRRSAAEMCIRDRILGDVTVGDHVIELHTGGNASQVTALIDGGEGVVVVVQTLGVGLRCV